MKLPLSFLLVLISSYSFGQLSEREIRDLKTGRIKNDTSYVYWLPYDGSTAHYWHLEQNGVIVKMGDRVTRGQIIGFSGNTGYTAFPHLHFQVIDAGGKDILPRFRTKKGSIYLRPGRWYKSVN